MTNEQKWDLINNKAKEHKSGEISFGEFMDFVSDVVCNKFGIEYKGGIAYQVIEIDAINGCNGCYFYTGICDGLPCCSINRSDDKNVIFKKL